MADQPLLEVNCTNCPGDQACDDCVVRFFLTGRDAAVVPLAGRAVRRAVGDAALPPALDALDAGLDAELESGLPADLAAALATLAAAGMAPEVLSVTDHDAIVTGTDTGNVTGIDAAARAS